LAKDTRYDPSNVAMTTMLSEEYKKRHKQQRPEPKCI